MSLNGLFQVPLINPATVESWLAKYEAATRQFAVLKSPRKLGAPHLDDIIQQGRNIVMCPACWHKYPQWWKRFDYRPDWDQTYFGDCDGCGMVGIRANLFIREDLFFKVLTRENHGWKPKP